MSTAALRGLVLAGGRSERMRRDKASLAYAGRPQLDRAVELIAPFVTRTFVSVRPDQIDEPQRASYERIVDLHPGLGPLAGIEAAQQAHPEAAWLVLACDLPFLSASALSFLVTHRDPARMATAYRSRFDSKPEPLCAVYEPASREPLQRWIASGRNCPRAWLGSADVRLLDLPEPQALDNVNTAEEYAAASAALASSTAARDAPRQVQVRYFALLREQAGRSSEALQTHARTPRELYEQLQRERGLQLEPRFLRVAINEEFGEWQQPLQDGDTVAFLPPVAGG